MAGPFVLNEQDAMMRLIESHVELCGALRAKPNHLLFAVERQPPGVRRAHMAGVQLSGSHALELGMALGIRALIHFSGEHQQTMGCGPGAARKLRIKILLPAGLLNVSFASKQRLFMPS